MPCTPFRLPGGISGIICARGPARERRCSVEGCNAPSGFQCDFQTKPGKTCDRHLCAVHAHLVGADTHFCPTHLAESSGKKQGDLFA
ncbi:hypothetical protein KPB04_28055 [Burkholderia cenocepacia]|uniref:hypothetical protein n=1 Tax=Burkholderia cenocepacia TaxID=95486 RepID=UPI002863FA3B|nr:hypothetical protein [Burkholderia cenocepacia]MDR8105593.1 hypothetical protein [Burkholderia cenocepacia]